MDLNAFDLDVVFTHWKLHFVAIWMPVQYTGLPSKTHFDWQDIKNPTQTISQIHFVKTWGAVPARPATDWQCSDLAHLQSEREPEQAQDIYVTTLYSFSLPSSSGGSDWSPAHLDSKVSFVFGKVLGELGVKPPLSQNFILFSGRENQVYCHSPRNSLHAISNWDAWYPTVDHTWSLYQLG